MGMGATTQGVCGPPGEAERRLVVPRPLIHPGRPSRGLEGQHPPLGSASLRRAASGFGASIESPVRSADVGARTGLIHSVGRVSVAGQVRVRRWSAAADRPQP